MSSHHNSILNFSHSPYSDKSFINEIDSEIKLGELRLRYVKLLRDIHTSLSNDKAKELVNESFAIWEKISKTNFSEKSR